jgi:hypothetical protein
MMRFFVSSVQDLNKLIRTAARKVSQDTRNSAAVEGSENPKTAEELKSLSDTADEYREIHIRLVPRAMYSKTDLYSLKDCMEENPGACPVFIHIPASGRGEQSKETIIKTSGQTGGPGSISVLTNCAAVAEAWYAR